jgi:hypothetical protein
MAIQKARPSRPGPSTHPEESTLETFLRGDLTREETRLVVRHLLTGCPACRQVTRRLWELGMKKTCMEGGSLLMTDIEAAQARLREIVRDLETLKHRLTGVLASLPPSPAETDRLLEFEPADPGTGIRTVIQCVLHDSIEPAIGDLRDAASDPTPGPTGGKG